MDDTNTIQPARGIDSDMLPPWSPLPPYALPSPAEQRHIRKAKRTKMKDAQSRILLIATCLAYILTVFTTLSLSFQEISLYLKPGLETARVELRAQNSARYREGILYNQLEDLLDTRLGHGFGETYEDCLARGLQKANQKFFGIGFHYADTRNASMKWTTDECIRLMFVPQPQHPSPQQIILTRWASATYRARRAFEKSVDMVALGWERFTTVLGIRSASVVECPKFDKLLTRKLESIPTRAPMPFGFGLNCTGSVLCRLAYSKADTSVDKVAVSHDELVNKDLRFQAQSRLVAKVKLFQYLMMGLAALFMPLVGSSLITYGVIGHYLDKGMPYLPGNHNMAQRPIKKNGSQSTAEERYAFQSIMIQFVLMILHVLGQHEHELNLVVGVSLLLIGISMAINFVFPVTPQLESIAQLYGAVKDLYFTIYPKPEEPATVHPQLTEADNTPAAPEEPAFEQLDDESTPAQSSVPFASSSRKSSTIQSLLDPHASTVEQDPRGELDTMRQKPTYEASVETASDSDFDGEQYVDLAGSGIPTPTDEESEDVIVDDD